MPLYESLALERGADPRRGDRAGEGRRRRARPGRVRPPRSARARRHGLRRPLPGHGCRGRRARPGARGRPPSRRDAAAPRGAAAPPSRSPARRYADAPGGRAARQPGLLARGGRDRVDRARRRGAGDRAARAAVRSRRESARARGPGGRPARPPRTSPPTPSTRPCGCTSRRERRSGRAGRPRCCSTARGCGSPTSGAGVGCGGPPS